MAFLKCNFVPYKENSYDTKNISIDCLNGLDITFTKTISDQILKFKIL